MSRISPSARDHFSDFDATSLISMEERGAVYRTLIEYGAATDKTEWLVADHILKLKRHRVFPVAHSNAFYDRNRNNSHENALRHIEYSDGWKRVTGWAPRGRVYVLHSVVEKDGLMQSVTKKGLGSCGIDFFPDPYLSWVQNIKGMLEPQWCGASVKSGVRMDPERMTEDSRRILRMLYNGVEIAHIHAEMQACGFPI